jgi:hypothetical protein
MNRHLKDHLTRSTSCCNRNGKYIYKFPQRLSPHTTIDKFGRVHFCRRREEDAWVVPDVPALMEYLNCYIYIDVCSSVTIFMYLFKYLFKGPDQTHFVLCAMSSPEGDEITNEFQDYINGCYLSASETVYWILQFNIVTKRPGV